MHDIRICLGSSCFSRANGANLRVIQEYVAARGIAARVTLAGHLCEDQCAQGPNLIIDGVTHHRVDAARIRALLDQLCSEEAAK